MAAHPSASLLDSLPSSLEPDALVAWLAQRPLLLLAAAATLLALAAARGGALREPLAWLAWARGAWREIAATHGPAVDAELAEEAAERASASWRAWLLDEDEREDAAVAADDAAASAAFDSAIAAWEVAEGAAADAAADAADAADAAAAARAQPARRGGARGQGPARGAVPPQAPPRPMRPPRVMRPVQSLLRALWLKLRRLPVRTRAAALSSVETLRLVVAESEGFGWGSFALGIILVAAEQLGRASLQMIGLVSLATMQNLGKSAKAGGGADGGAHGAGFMPATASSTSVVVCALARQLERLLLRVGMDASAASAVAAPLVACGVLSLGLELLLNILSMASASAFSAARGSRVLDRKRRFARACASQDLSFQLAARCFFDEGSEAVDNVLVSTLPSSFSTLLSFARSIVLMAFLDVRLGLLALALAVPQTVGNPLYRLHQRVSLLFGRASEALPQPASLPWGQIDTMRLQMFAQEEAFARGACAGTAERERLQTLQAVILMPIDFVDSFISAVCENALKVAAGLKMLASLSAAAAAGASVGAGSAGSAATATAVAGAAIFGFMEYRQIEQNSDTLAQLFTDRLPQLRVEFVQAALAVKRYVYLRARKSRAAPAMLSELSELREAAARLPALATAEAVVRESSSARSGHSLRQRQKSGAAAAPDAPAVPVSAARAASRSATTALVGPRDIARLPLHDVAQLLRAASEEAGVRSPVLLAETEGAAGAGADHGTGAGADKEGGITPRTAAALGEDFLLRSCLVALPQSPSAGAGAGAGAGAIGAPVWQRVRLRGAFRLTDVSFKYPALPDVNKEMGIDRLAMERAGMGAGGRGGHARRGRRGGFRGGFGGGFGGGRGGGRGGGFGGFRGGGRGGGGGNTLRSISLEIKAGSVVGFAGKKGCGKSTLLSLLTRIYEPTGGRIELDGLPLSAFEPRSLRREVGWVPQAPGVEVGLTIWENIVYGLEEELGLPAPWEAAHANQLRLFKEGEEERAADRRAARGEGAAPSAAAAAPASNPEAEAARQRAIALAEVAGRVADLASFVGKFSKGYETVIQHPSLLSPGEAQSLAIARAVARNPAVLLLDEPTSALDPVSERALVQTLAQVSRGRTTIIVAHRLSTLRGVDQIVFFKDGRVAETGSWADLMARPQGLFAAFAGEEEVKYAARARADAEAAEAMAVGAVGEGDS